MAFNKKKRSPPPPSPRIKVFEPSAPTYKDLQDELDAMQAVPELPPLPKTLPNVFRLKSKSSPAKLAEHFAAFQVKKDLLLSIKGLLRRCDVCLESKLSDDWYKCKPEHEVFQWHFICPRCKEEGRSCEELHKEKNGGVKIVQVQRDSIQTFANRILEQLPKTCKYDTLGCDQVLFDMTAHQKNCKYRPIYCAHLACSTQVPYVDYFKHFEGKHLNVQKMTIQDENFVLKFELNDFNEYSQHLPARIMAFGKTFFEVGLVKDQVMFRWVYFYGYPDEAKDFYYFVSIKKEDSDEELTYLGQVHSLVLHFNDIIKDYEAFFVPLKKIEKFLDCNANLKFDVKILRKQDLNKKNM